MKKQYLSRKPHINTNDFVTFIQRLPRDRRFQSITSYFTLVAFSFVVISASINIGKMSD